ncbi:MAG: efflux RND transporter periplasmic adaptor subunit [Anaerolineaceae bacterium]
MAAENKTKKGKKTGKTILTLVIILAVVAAVFFYSRYQQEQENISTLNDLELVAYERETLVSSISGTGTVRPNQEALLLWETSGTVGEVPVSLGDQVRQDDLLLQLDEKALPLDILQAQMDQLTAEDALANLDQDAVLRKTQLEADITSGIQTLQTMQDELELLQNRSCVDWRIDDLQANYDDALATYQDWPTQTNLAKVQNTKTELDFCLPEKINQLISEKQAQIDLQKETIASWQAEADTLKEGPDPDDKRQLELQLEIANKRLESLELLAPFDGTITALYTQTGDRVSTGAQAVQVSDLSRLIVETPISEVDIPSVQVGQPVELVFDAFFDDTYTGTVSEVSEVGVSQQGVINYTVTIELENGLDVIKPGMTAGVTIMVEEKTDAFVVPSEAVTTSEGLDVVYVLRDGVPVMEEVKIGSYSNNKIEILAADIEEGELIVLNPPSSILDNIPSGLNFR